MSTYADGHVAPALEVGDPVREAVELLVAALRSNDEDPTRCATDVESALAPLTGLREELFACVACRPSKIPGHQMATIYFDPSLMIQIVGAPRGFRLPPHTHSAWNVLFVSDGEMQFTWYRRRDDRSVDGRAELEVGDDRVLHGGQAGIVAPPPHDIHELEVLSEYLWMVVVTPEPEVRDREIYSPEVSTYEVKQLAPLPPLLSAV